MCVVLATEACLPLLLNHQENAIGKPKTEVLLLQQRPLRVKDLALTETLCGLEDQTNFLGCYICDDQPQSRKDIVQTPQCAHNNVN